MLGSLVCLLHSDMRYQMKKLFAVVLAALYSSAIFATTLSPIQLLNPAGSTSGQAILSTGASSAPAWGNVSLSGLSGTLPVANGGTNAATASGTSLDNITGFSGTGFLTRTGAGAYAFQSATNGITLGNLAQAAANTVLGNSIGATGSIVAITMPSCSTSASALDWSLGVGFVCNAAVNAATLGGATFASPGAIGGSVAGPANFTTINTSGLITPSTTVGIKGTAVGDSAQAGSIGEYQTVTGSAVSISAATTSSATSLSLTAGDWDVEAVVLFTGAGTTQFSLAYTGVSFLSTTLGAVGTYVQVAAPTTAGASFTLASPVVRINLSTTTTVFCDVNAGFTVSTATATGFLRARRVR